VSAGTVLLDFGTAVEGIAIGINSTGALKLVDGLVTMAESATFSTTHAAPSAVADGANTKWVQSITSGTWPRTFAPSGDITEHRDASSTSGPATALGSNWTLSDTSGVLGESCLTASLLFRVSSGSGGSTPNSMAFGGRIPIIPVGSVEIGEPISVLEGAALFVPVLVRGTDQLPYQGISVTLGSGTPAAATVPGGAIVSGVDGISTFTLTGVAPGTSLLTATADGGVAVDTASAVVLPASSAPVWSTTSLPVATVGTPYSATVFAAGTGVTYSIQSGNPGWLSVGGSSGVLSGTPSGAVTASVVIRATGSNGLFVDRTFTLTTYLAPAVTTAGLPDAAVGSAYSVTLAATGSTPITWSVVAGALPAGLSLNGSTGAITGTPTSLATTQTFTVRASNAASIPGDRTLTIVVRTDANAPAITTLSLPDGVVGSSLVTTIGALGAPTIAWSILFQTTAGATINGSTGQLTVPSQAAGTYQVTVRAANAFEPAAQRTFTVRFNEPVPEPVARRSTIGPDGGGVSWRLSR
jgi:hypothetical protein